MELNIRSKILIIIFSIFLFLSCDGKNSIDSQLVGKYKTEYIIHYAYGYHHEETIYTDKEVYSCSFQGTNFLLEKDNPEEILSTTAPIQIIKSEIVK